ncbi:MAG: purine-nucleoside phosphorylase [Oscillospiraceae bacterium]|nr:purine-nucleoside phosphorylase [Oscillospiraceae bacterium]
MAQTPTPHNGGRKEDVAKIVLMQGDPLRTQYTAEKFLENPKQFTGIRGIVGYTGTYRGKEVSVMGHGMGCPSIGIYSYELFNFYDVDTIIRTGSAGCIADHLSLRSIVLAQGCSTDSNYGDQYQLPGTFAPLADFNVLMTAYETAKEMNIDVEVGNVVTSDVFYNANPEYNLKWKNMGILAVEMEAAALYMNAAHAGKRALTMCTVSDNVFTGETIPNEERERGLDKMLTLALETARKL